MTRLHKTSAHRHIFRRHVYAPSVAVAPRLKDDRIISLVENAILHQHPPGSVYVDSVIVVAMSSDVKIPCDDILAKADMYRPQRTVPYLESVKKHISAFLEFDAAGTEPRSRQIRQNPLFDRYIVFAPFIQFAHCGKHFRRFTVKPRPPYLHPRPKHTLACHGNVRRTVRMEQRRIVETFYRRKTRP